MFLHVFSKGSESSIYERLYIYKGIIRMVRDNLWFAVGLGCFVYYFPKYALKDDTNIKKGILEILRHAVTP